MQLQRQLQRRGLGEMSEHRVQFRRERRRVHPPLKQFVLGAFATALIPRSHVLINEVQFIKARIVHHNTQSWTGGVGTGILTCKQIFNSERAHFKSVAFYEQY